MIAAILALSLASPAIDETATESLTGGQLADLCGASAEGPALVCLTYLRGAVEGVISAEIALTDGEPSFCLPDTGVTLLEIRSAFLSFLRAEPDHRNEQAGVSLLYSLEDRYPCHDDDDEMAPTLLSANASAASSA